MAQQQGVPVPSTRRTSTQALVSLIAGIIAGFGPLVFCVSIPAFFVALACGFNGLRDIDQHPGVVGGRWLARSGIGLAVASPLVWALWFFARVTADR